ncbi:MAG: hypothetical protein R3E08_09970 [Thiotrichaceae bacterium]
MDIKKMFTRTLPEWTRDVPFQIKGIVVKEAVEAFWATLKAHKGKKEKSVLNSEVGKTPHNRVLFPKLQFSTMGFIQKSP